MKRTIILLALGFISLNLLSRDYKSEEERVNAILKEIKDKHVPDTKVTVFDVSVTLKADSVLFTGAIMNKEALNELLARTKEIGQLVIENKIITLPHAELNDTLYGVINVSVADIRTQNRFTSGMATQSLLGTPIKLFQHDAWYRIQLPDTYFGWVHQKQIVPMNKKEYNKWLLAPKVIFTKHYGFAYLNADNSGPIVSDLVAGNTLRFAGIEGDYFKVIYPDKREAYVLRSESQEFALWVQSRKLSANSFIEIAKSMTGIPYVWGGTSTKGMDCSGLVSTVMQLHGLTILRDASQQSNVGDSVDITKGYDNLQVGDLMFFGKQAKGEQKESVRHVGFYLGNMKFLHASGWTRISSLDPNDSDFDELNTKEFIKATRIVDGKKGLRGVKKLKDNPFYLIQK